MSYYASPKLFKKMAEHGADADAEGEQKDAAQIWRTRSDHLICCVDTRANMCVLCSRGRPLRSPHAPPTPNVVIIPSIFWPQVQNAAGRRNELFRRRDACRAADDETEGASFLGHLALAFSYAPTDR